MFSHKTNITTKNIQPKNTKSIEEKSVKLSQKSNHNLDLAHELGYDRVNPYFSIIQNKVQKITKLTPKTLKDLFQTFSNFKSSSKNIKTIKYFH